MQICMIFECIICSTAATRTALRGALGGHEIVRGLDTFFNDFFVKKHENLAKIGFQKRFESDFDGVKSTNADVGLVGFLVEADGLEEACLLGRVLDLKTQN